MALGSGLPSHLPEGAGLGGEGTGSLQGSTSVGKAGCVACSEAPVTVTASLPTYLIRLPTGLRRRLC